MRLILSSRDSSNKLLLLFYITKLEIIENKFVFVNKHKYEREIN